MEQRKQNNTKRQFSQYKLALILDLDHTLVHSVNATKPITTKIPFPYKVHTIYTSTNEKLYVCIRPYVLEFLQILNKYYELSVFTMGTRQYARAICSILDPNEIYFRGRIVSRDELPDRGKTKSLSLLLPCDEDLVIIVDDRLDIWPVNLHHHIIPIYPFFFFSNAREVYDRDSNKNTNANNSNNDEPQRCLSSPLHDTVLFSIVPILIGIWYTFYIQFPPSLKVLYSIPRIGGQYTSIDLPNKDCAINIVPLINTTIQEDNTQHMSLINNDGFINVNTIQNAKDFVLPSHSSTRLLQSLLRRNILYNVRILFSRFGLRREINKMPEVRIAQELGATFVTIDTLKRIVDTSSFDLEISYKDIPTHIVAITDNCEEVELAVAFNR